MSRHFPCPQRKDEHAKDAVIRITKGVGIPWPNQLALMHLANSQELAKGQLKGHLQESRIENRNLSGKLEETLSALFMCGKDNEELHAMLRDAQSALQTERKKSSESEENWSDQDQLEMQKLKDELEQARSMRSDDDSLVKLYIAGTNFMAKQTDEIKRLKDEIEREKIGNRNLNRLLALKMSEKKQENTTLVENVQRLEGRLASLTTESTDAEADLRRKVAESKHQANVAFALASKLQVELTTMSEVVENPSDSTLASFDTADLLDRIHILEQRCQNYRSMMGEQEKHAERLEEENWKLAKDL